LNDNGVSEMLNGRRPNRFGELYRRDMPVTAFLTNHELDVFLRLAVGESVPEIARSINRVPKTIEARKTRLMQKLGLKRRTEITFLAIRDGLIRIDEFGRAEVLDPRVRTGVGAGRAAAGSMAPSNHHGMSNGMWSTASAS
jgi:DNA-binding CsgD family transcriptional regulator